MEAASSKAPGMAVLDIPAIPVNSPREFSPHAPRTSASRPATFPDIAMNPTLIIGNKNYSSWSLRPWLYSRRRGLPSED